VLAGLEAEREGAFLLAFRAAALLGRAETGEADGGDRALLRVVTPLAKLTTARQAVQIASEALECFGGAGYVEDTGLPRLLRDAQVLPIWEGTTNVLSLDLLRALEAGGAREALGGELRRLAREAEDAAIRPAAAAALAAAERALSFLEGAVDAAREAGARGAALTLGRSLEALLLAGHAQWCLRSGRSGRAVAAARRLTRNGLDLVAEPSAEESRTLAE
jgi:hypothetical protein